jgi:hypothetical protein
MSHICTLRQPIAVPAFVGGAAHDPYAAAHTRLRVALSGLTVRLGCADPAADHTGLIADLRCQLAQCRRHLDDDEAIHAALRTVAPEAVEELELYHAHLTADFQALELLMRGVEAGGELRPLYLAFTRFVAACFAHMAHEELETLPILQGLFTDAELLAITAPMRTAA